MTAADSAITPLPPRQFALVLTGALLVLAIGTFDGTALSTALPKIAAEFDGLPHLFWVNLAFGVPAVVMGPMYGKLRDRFGAKRLIYVAIGIFLAGSLLSGLSTSLGQLIAFRAIQGVGGGGLGVLAHIIIGEISPPSKRARYQALVGANFAIAASSGPVLGGLITDALTWRWVFYISIPVAVAGLLFVGFGLKQAPPTGRRAIDYFGFISFALAAAGALILLGQAGGAQTLSPAVLIALAVTTLVAGGAFVVAERAAVEPLFPQRLLKNGQFVAPALANALVFAAFQVQMLYMPLYFQAVMSMTAAASGLLMVGSSGGLFVASLSIVHWKIWQGRQKLAALTGVAVVLASFGVVMAATVLGAPWWVFAGGFLTTGLGGGLAIPNIMAAVQNSVPKEDLGVATATAGFSRSIVPLAAMAGAGALLNGVMTALLGPGFGLTPQLEQQLLQPRAGGPLPDRLQSLLLAYHGGLDAVVLLALLCVVATLALVMLMRRGAADTR